MTRTSTPRRSPRKASRSTPVRMRTVLEWSAEDDVYLDLEDRMARARGKRVRQLALLGLLAERNGIRLDSNGTLVMPSHLVRPTPGTEPAPSPRPSPPDDLDRLAQSLLGFTP